MTERRLNEMNDTSPRLAEAQTGAALLSSTEEGAVSLTELIKRTGELSVWFTEEGLRGATAGELFEGYCKRLSAMDFVIMRAYVSTQTLHPQWTGYGYTWRRELSSVREQQFARGPISHEWLSSPFNALIQRSLAGEKILGCGAGWNSVQSNETFPCSQNSTPRARRIMCACPFSLERRAIRRTEPASFIRSRLIGRAASGQRKLICCVLRSQGCRSR